MGPEYAPWRPLSDAQLGFIERQLEGESPRQGKRHRGRTTACRRARRTPFAANPDPNRARSGAPHRLRERRLHAELAAWPGSSARGGRATARQADARPRPDRARKAADRLGPAHRGRDDPRVSEPVGSRPVGPQRDGHHRRRRPAPRPLPAALALRRGPPSGDRAQCLGPMEPEARGPSRHPRTRQGPGGSRAQAGSAERLREDSRGPAVEGPLRRSHRAARCQRPPGRSLRARRPQPAPRAAHRGHRRHAGPPLDTARRRALPARHPGT